MQPEEMKIDKNLAAKRKAKDNELNNYIPQIRPCIEIKKTEVDFLSKISVRSFLDLHDHSKRNILTAKDLSNPLLTPYIEISKIPIVSNLDFSEFITDKNPDAAKVNEKISMLCENLKNYFDNTSIKGSFITAAINQPKFAAFLESKRCDANSNPSTAIEQHLPRYQLTLSEIMKNNKGILLPETKAKIETTIATIAAFTKTIENTKILADLGYSPEQIISLSSEEEKINTLVDKITKLNQSKDISEDIYTLLKENPASEITSIISKEQPEKIAETLKEHHTKMVGLEKKLQPEQYLALAKKLKLDFYLNQIENPSLKEAIRSTLEKNSNITFHATAGITPHIQAKFSGGIHASTTLSLIGKLNTAQEKYSQKNLTMKQKAEKDIKEYLSQLGLKAQAEEIIKTINQSPSSNPSAKLPHTNQQAASFIQPQIPPRVSVLPHAPHTPRPLPSTPPKPKSDKALKQPQDTLITSTKLSTDQKTLPPSNTPNSSSGVKSLIAKFSNQQGIKTGTLNWQKNLESTPTEIGPTWRKPVEVKPTNQPTPPNAANRI